MVSKARVHSGADVITVLVVDDEHLVRAGLRNILAVAGDISVVGEAGDGRQAVQLVCRAAPDVVLLDAQMPGVDGLAVLGELATLPRRPAVIVLTTLDLDEYLYLALRRGAVGYLLKHAPPGDIRAAVRAVAAGEAVITPSVTRRLLDRFAVQASPQALAARELLRALTPRERQVLELVGSGRSNAEIARVLTVSKSTVKAHVSQILAKLGLVNRVQAAVLVQQVGNDFGRG